MSSTIDPVETAELLAFTRAAEAKSLSRAAAELRTPRATLGRRLARLEERLGTRLIRRTSRALALTPAGERFYQRAHSILEALDEAEANVRAASREMRGELRVTVPLIPSSADAARSFHEMVVGFAKEHRDVRLQIEHATRVSDLHRDGYDVALRATLELQPGLVARKITRNVVIAVASPKYLTESGTPLTEKELKRHRCLTPFARGELPLTEWPARRGVVHVDSVFASNDLGLLREAAVGGLGIALLPKLLVARQLESGALVQVLAGIVESVHHVAVVYPEREGQAAHVRAFVEALSAWAPALHGEPDRVRSLLRA